MSSTLNLQLLVKKLQKIADWFMLGVHLGVPKEELNKIDQQFLSHGVERCKAELFDLWLRRNPSARWDDVASALERLNEVALASEIREFYQISDIALELSTGTAPSATLPPLHDDGEQEALEVELNKSTVRQFAKLESKFALLVCNVKTTTEKRGVLPENLHSFLEVRLNQDIKFCPTTSISDLFKCITPYYCFLNTTLLENIIDGFLGEPLQQQLDEYEGLLQDFTSSTKIRILEKINLKTVAQHKGMPLVILKLAGRCLDVTIKRFQELVKHIFGEESNALSNIQVKHGCICITWNTRESAVPSLTGLAKEKIKYMKLVGIIKMTVGELIIFEQDTEEWKKDNSSLEDLLMQSVTSGCTAAVEFLLNAGADPSQVNAYDKSVLGFASVNGFTRIAKLLIDAGASVDQVDTCNLKMTPLMLACEESHEEIVHLLLQSGADPCLKTDSGLTALLCVDYNDCFSLSIIKSLLKAGAAVNSQDNDGHSSLIMACEYGCYKIAELLIQYGADVQLRTVDKFTPLMIACQNRHEDIAALLLNSQADSNLQNSDKETALMMACQHQLTQTVSLLLSSGADTNLQSQTGWTALMISFSAHDFDDFISSLLLSAGAKPNLQTKTGQTALMLAARYHESGVRILLNVQACVDIQDHFGNTALHYSALNGNLAVTELLLSGGADRTIVNSDDKTALNIAFDSKHDDMFLLLLSHPVTSTDDESLSPSPSSTPEFESEETDYELDGCNEEVKEICYHYCS